MIFQTDAKTKACVKNMTQTDSQSAEVEVTRSEPYEASHKQGQTMSEKQQQ